MTLQHWAFSFKGRIGRRDFWAGFALCFVLFCGLYTVNQPFWQWAIGRFLPSFIMMIMLLDCGVFIGTQGENYFGATTEKVDYSSFR